MKTDRASIRTDDVQDLVSLSDGQASVTIDTTRFPLLISDWVGAPSPGLVEQYYTAYVSLLNELAADGRRCVMLTTTEKAARPSADARERIAKLTDEHAALIQSIVVANAVVLTNPLIRGAMTAISWMNPTVRVPYLSSLEAGYAWATEELDRHGVTALFPGASSRPPA